MASNRTLGAPSTRGRRNDHGFTLLELIIAIVVIALLAGIAITAYLLQRKKGVDSTLKQDMHFISQALVNASANTGSGYATTAASKELLYQQGASFTEGNEYEIGLDPSGAYCIRGWNPNGTADGAGGGFFWYDSQLGGAQPGPTTTAPPGGACDGVDPDDWIAPGGTSAPPAPTGGPSPTGPGGGGPTVIPTLPGGGGPSGSTTSAGTGSPSPTETEEPPPANDECADAFALNQPGSNLTSVQATGTNANATDDAQGVSTVFWRGAFPAAGWATIEMYGSSAAKTLSVYRQSGAGCALSLVDSTQSTNPGVAWQTGAGDVYYFVVSSPPDNEGGFSLRLWRSDDAPDATSYTGARAFSTISNGGQTTTPVMSTLFGVPGGSDPEGFSSVWLTVRTTNGILTTPTYTLDILAPGNGRRAIGSMVIEVFRNGTSAAFPGTIVTQGNRNGPGSSISWSGPRAVDGTYYVRIRSTTGLSSGDFIARLSRS